MASYPASIPSLGTVTGSDHLQVAQFNTPNDEIEAIATELGVNPRSIDDTIAPGATPASVAAYLDMLANIAKTLAGVSAWYKAAVPARIHIGGHGNGSTVAIGTTSYGNLFGRNLTATEASGAALATFSSILLYDTFWYELLTAQGSGANDFLDISIRKNLSTVYSMDVVTPSTPAGVYRVSPFQVRSDISYAVNDQIAVEFSQHPSAGAASAQIGAFGFEMRQVG